MPKKLGAANKENKKEQRNKPQNIPPEIKIPESLEAIISEKKIRDAKKRFDKKAAKTSHKKEQKAENILKKLDKASLENNVKLPELKPVEQGSIKTEGATETSPEEIHLVRESPPRLKIIYEDNSDAQIRATSREEPRQRKYQERVEGPTPTQVRSAGRDEENRPGAYSTRAIYGTPEQKKERVYTIEERSFQMANILADKSPQPEIRNPDLFFNERLMEKKTDSHEEYSLDLKEQKAPKPKRRYPWEA